MSDEEKPETSSYHSKLVGVTFEGRQDVIKVLKGNEPLRVRREADNEYDDKAVAVDVMFGEGWTPIGYIAKDKNKDIAATLDAKGSVYIAMSEITGGNDKSYGVNVKLEYIKSTAQAPSKTTTKALTPLETLSKAFEDYKATVSDIREKYASRILGKATEVTVVDGHMRIEGYLSGSKFPQKFFTPFDEEGILDAMELKHKVSKEHIKQMWELNKLASTSYGTGIHAAMENYDTYHKLGDKIKSVKSFKTKDAEIGPNKALSRNPFLAKIVNDFHQKFGGDYLRLSEQFIWLHDEMLSGSVDRIKVIDAKKKIIRIQDFKTDGDIHETKYQVADSPFKGLSKKELDAGRPQKKNAVPNTLMGYHWLQLSFYAYILRQYGYTVEGLDIYWVNPNKLIKGENPWEEFSHHVIEIKEAL